MDSPSAPLFGDGVIDVLHGPMSCRLRARGFDPRNLAEYKKIDFTNALLEIHAEDRDAGCTIGATATSGLSNTRPRNHDDWHYDSEHRFTLDDDHRAANKNTVRAAQAIFGARLLACILPLANTDGTDDRRMESLGKDAVMWALQRHRPQMKLFSECGIKHFIVEAARYLFELEALAILGREFGMQTFIASMRHERASKFPDPQHQSHRRSDVIDTLTQASKSTMKIHTGANCMGSDTYTQWHQKFPEEAPDVVYPNASDPEHAGLSQTDFENLVRKSATDLSPDSRSKLHQAQSSPSQFLTAWTIAAKSIRAIGGCCGTTYQHVALAQALIQAEMNPRDSKVEDSAWILFGTPDRRFSTPPSSPQ